jgi:4-amino-4-deoxy-L-arabinose transferase-like glycosyltransferase
MSNSPFGKLNLRDLINGLVVAFLTASLTGLVQVLDSGVLPTLAELKSAGLAGVVASLAYLLKNLVTNSQGEMAKVEQAAGEDVA